MVILRVGLLILCFLSFAAQAQVVVESASIDALHEHTEILRQAELDWQLEDVLHGEAQGEFEAFSGVAASSDRHHAVWLKLDLRASSELREATRILVAHAISELEADFYVLTDSGWQHTDAGLTTPFADSSRTNYRHPAIRLDLSDEPTLVYMRFYDPAGSVFPLELLTMEDFSSQRMHENLIFGVIFGVITGLLFYNLMLWAQLRDRVYFWYVLSMFSALILLLDGTGIGPQLVWPQLAHPWWLNRVSTAAMWGFSVVIFALYFLQLERHLTVAAKTVKLSACLFVVVYVANAAGLSLYASLIANGLAVLMIPVLLVAAFIRWRQGFRPAMYFLFAQGIMLIAALTMVMRQLTWLQPEEISTLWFPGAVALEAILFSLALADRIGELKSQRHAAVREAYHDSLTELLNRRGMMEKLKQLSPANEYTLVLIDLDGFKPINDAYGHAIGDQVLICVAKRIKASTRLHGSEWVIRFGGDEFGIMVGHELNQPDNYCERIRAAVEAPMQVGGERIEVGASVGFSKRSPDELFDAVYRRADRALYEDKSARKARADGQKSKVQC